VTDCWTYPPHLSFRSQTLISIAVSPKRSNTCKVLYRLYARLRGRNEVI
jgi:hypothetical protein